MATENPVTAGDYLPPYEADMDECGGIDLEMPIRIAVDDLDEGPVWTPEDPDPVDAALFGRPGVLIDIAPSLDKRSDPAKEMNKILAALVQMQGGKVRISGNVMARIQATPIMAYWEHDKDCLTIEARRV